MEFSMFLFILYGNLYSVCFALNQVNACLGRDAYASQGPHTEGDRNASQAVDGNTDQSTNYALARELSMNGTAWWSIDLGYRRSIVNLTVLLADNTDNSVQTIKRRYGYEIYVSNFPDSIAKYGTKYGSLCYHDTGDTSPAPPRISISSCRIPSRYIRLYNTRPTNVSSDASDWPYLEITEAIAMIETGEKICSAGQFGWDCQLTCHCAGSDQCDTNNGDCPGDCAEGWMGPKCQLQAEDHGAEYIGCYLDGRDRDLRGYFTQDFRGMTPQKCINECKAKGFVYAAAQYSEECFCGESYGKHGSLPESYCKMSCSGDKNLTCGGGWANSVYKVSNEGCAQGSYGSECWKLCGQCQVKSCNRDDGACGECLPGWYGNDCQQQCSSSCPNKKCDKNTGHCTEPCALGFYGNLCNETCSKKCLRGCESNSGKCVTCPLYQYGDLCEQNCSTNCKATNCSGRICNRDSGHCSCGCKDKTFGDTCDGNCPSNCIQCDNFDSCFICEPDHWGKQCETPCSIDCLNQRCDQVSGKCYGCDGFKYGDMCEIECPDNCEGLLCYQNGTCQKGCTDQSYYGNRCDIHCNRTHPSCKECRQNSTGDIECSSCVDGRHGLKCELICPKNCANCRNDSLCTQCEVGFTGELCDTPCGVQNCSECDINRTCRVCLPGLYGHHCESNCQDCKTCISNGSKQKGHSCLSCKKGHFLYESRGECFACDYHCESCVSWTNCTSCIDGYHGTLCNKKCPENCVSCLSNKECTSCNTSWTGTVCQCNMKHCITDSDQSKWCSANGTCLKGCLKGFYGDRCQYKCARNCLSCEQKGGKCLECAASQYGADCHENCSAYCAEKDVSGAPICRFSDGSCNFCDAGWFGGKCDVSCNKNCRMSGGIHACHQKDGSCESCEGDKYGPSCNLDCAQNCHDRFGVNSCYKSDGSCRSCVDGFHGAYCNNSCSGNCKTSCKQVDGDCDECVSGYYGKVCENRCPSSCGRGVHSKMIVCNRSTGECLFCKEGYYGAICLDRCNSKCRGEKCLIDDGKCSDGCVSGYRGDFCTLLVQPEDFATVWIVGGIIAALVVVIAVIITFILLRRRYFGKPVRKGNSTRVHKRAVKNDLG